MCMCHCACACVCVCVCFINSRCSFASQVCLCVCARERERETDKEREREREKERKRESHNICVCHDVRVSLYVLVGALAHWAIEKPTKRMAQTEFCYGLASQPTQPVSTSYRPAGWAWMIKRCLRGFGFFGFEFFPWAGTWIFSLSRQMSGDRALGQQLGARQTTACTMLAQDTR